jgi:hypothetical protein
MPGDFPTGCLGVILITRDRARTPSVRANSRDDERVLENGNARPQTPSGSPLFARLGSEDFREVLRRGSRKNMITSYKYMCSGLSRNAVR